MTYQEIVELTAEHVMYTYKRLPVAFVRGEGCKLWDAEGQEWLDFVGGIAVCSQGHCHPKVVAAIREQAGLIMHTSNLYYIGPQARLAEKLCRISFADKVFFCNSGAEANEAAIKLARKYAEVHYGPQRHEIIAARGSFHGRTMTTLTATGQEKFHQHFHPLMPGFEHVDLNDLEALRAAITPQTCAVLLEPVQGESGVRPCAAEYLPAVRELCDEHELLLILDEIQCGLGRTGKWFAYEHYGVKPDIMTLAKALGGGFPIGACACTDQVAAAFEPGDHATTFGGNHLACAAALAALEALEEEGLIENSARVGAYLRGGLQGLEAKFPLIREVRGMGLMAALELDRPGAADIQAELFDRQILVNAIGDRIVRMVPPLCVTEAECDRLLEALEGALGKMEA